jgi:hypothetical protein
MAEITEGLSVQEIEAMRTAVERAKGRNDYWLRNFGLVNPKYTKAELDERRRDIKALNQLRNLLAAAENRTRTGGSVSANRGGSVKRGV